MPVDSEPAIVPVLEYRTLVAKPTFFERHSKWLNRETSLFLIGLGGMTLISYVALMLRASPSEIFPAILMSFPFTAIVLLIAWPFTAIAVSVMHGRPAIDAIVEREISPYCAPTIFVVFFPAAYFVMCRLLAIPDYGDEYAMYASPLRFLLLWTTLCLVIAWRTRRESTWGRHRWHWIASGCLASLALFANLCGLDFLRISIVRAYVTQNARDDWITTLSMIWMLCTPLAVLFLIGMGGSPVMVDESSERSE